MRARYCIIDRQTGAEGETVSLPRLLSPDAVLRLLHRPAQHYDAIPWESRATTRRRAYHLDTSVVGRSAHRIALLTSTAYPHLRGGGELVWWRIAQHLRTQGLAVDWWVTHRSRYGVSIAPVEEAAEDTADGITMHYVPPADAVDTLVEWLSHCRARAVLSAVDWDVQLNARLEEIAAAAPLVIYQQFWQGLDCDGFDVPAGGKNKPGWLPYFTVASSRWGNSPMTTGRFAGATGLPWQIVSPPTDDALGQSSRDGEIVMVGAGWEKGSYIVTEIARHFADETFVLLGEPEREFGANVRAVGWCDPRPYLLRAKAALAPSLVTESYGMAVAEAGKYGVPTLVSDHGASVAHGSIALPVSDIDAWVAALRGCLSRRNAPRAVVTSRRDSLREVDAAMRTIPIVTDETMQFSSIGTYAHAGFTSTAYASDVLVRRFGIIDLNSTPDAPIRAAMFHAWHDSHRTLMERLRERGIAVWGVVHSPLAQAELDHDDVSIHALLELGADRLLWCHAPTALALDGLWMPVPLDLAEYDPHRRGSRPVGDELHVGLLNVRGVRKNLWTQLLACRELGRISGKRIIAHMSETPQPWQHDMAVGVEIVREPYRDRSDYLDLCASFDVALQVTHAESFNYCAVESYLLGVPCIVSAATPAGRFGMEGAFVVDDPTNPIEIAQRAWAAVQDASAEWFSDQLRRAVARMLDERDAALRVTLRRMMEAST